MRFFAITAIISFLFSVQTLFAQPAGFEFNDVEGIVAADIDVNQSNPSLFPYSGICKVVFEIDCDGLTQLAQNSIFSSLSMNPSIIESSAYNDTSPVGLYLDSSPFYFWTSDGDRDSDGTGIFARSISYSVTSPVLQVNQYSSGAQHSPAAAGDNYGFIVWESEAIDGNGTGISGRIIDSDGTFITNEFRVNTTTASNQSQPAIAYNGSNYLVIWSSRQVVYNSTLVYGIFGQFYDNDGTPNGGEFLIAENSGYDHTEPDIASDGTDFMVICHADSHVVARKVYANATLGSYFTVNDSTSTLISTGASIASNKKNYLVVWNDCTNLYPPPRPIFYIHAQLINLDGTKTDNNFTVNHYTVTGTNPDVFPLSNGSYNIVWSSQHDGESNRLICSRNLKYSGLTVIEEPTSQVYDENNTVKFFVRAQSEYPPIHYQWYLEGEEIGTDSPTLTLTGLTSDNNYDHVVCEISDQYDSYTTDDEVRLKYQKSTNGYSLNEWFYVPQSIEEKSDNPCISSNGTSHFACWDMMTQNMTTQCDVKGMFYNLDGTAITSPVRLNTTDAYNQVKPDSVFNGTYHLVVWESYISGYSEDIIGQFYTPDGTAVGSEFIINSTRTWNQKNPAVATNGSNFFVVWETYQQDNDGYAIAGCLVDGTTMIPGTEIVINQMETGSQLNPDVACDGAKYLAVWESNETSNPDIKGRYISSIGTLSAGDEFLISGYYYGSKPAVASASGSFCIVWERPDYYSPRMRYIQVDGTMDDIKTIWTSYRARDFAIAANTYDYIITAVIEQSSFDPIKIIAQRIYYDGTKLGGLNVVLADHGTLRNTAISTNGKDFMLLWTSVDEQGISRGIYGKTLTYTGSMFDRDCSDKSAFAGETITSMIRPTYPHGPVSYQWYYKGAAYGTDSNYVELPPLQLTDNDSTLYCVVTDSQASKSTNVATITVNEDPPCYTPHDEIMVHTDSTEYQIYPALFASGTNYRVLYCSDYDIYSRLFNQIGEPQGSPSLYNTSIYVPGLLEVAFNGTHYFAVYARSSLGSYIKGQIFDVSGNPVGSELTISETYLDDIKKIDIATDGSTFFITWAGYIDTFTDDDDDVYGRIVNSDGTFAGSEIPVSQLSGNQTAPAVAYNGTVYLVVWSASTHEIRAQMYAASGSPIGSEFTVSPANLSSSSGIDIMSISTDYLVVWSTGNSLYIQRINALGTLVGTAVEVNTPPENPAAYDPVFAATDSDILLTWIDDNAQYSSSSDIHAQLLDLSLNPLGSSFIVNTHLSNAQRYAAVTSDGVNYAVCWTSEAQYERSRSTFIKTLTYKGPLLSAQPVSQTVHEEDTAIFSVSTAHSHGTPTYKWYSRKPPNKPVVAGLTRVLYLYNVPYSADGTEYYCVVSDDDGSTKSQTAVLTVTPLLAITQHPVDQSTYENEPVSFTVSTNYNNSLHYQWYKVASPVDIAVPGATRQQLTFEYPTLAMDGTQYYCRVTRLGDTAVSNPATLTVIEPAFTVSINGPASVFENSVYHGTGSIYNAYADYGSGPVNVTSGVVWEVLTPSAGSMINNRFYSVDIPADMTAVIKATYSDGTETHWATFDVSVTNFLQVTSMSPMLTNGMPTAPHEIEIGFTRIISYTHPSSTWSLVRAGDDNIFNTADDITVNATITTANHLDHITFQINDEPVQNELYRLTLGLYSASGHHIDGEFSGTLPSGNFTLGGDFVVDFSFEPRIISFTRHENDSVRITWYPFSTQTMAYEVLYCDDISNAVWHPVGDASLFPVFKTRWEGDDISTVSEERYYRVVGSYSSITAVSPSVVHRGDTNIIVNITGWNTNWVSGAVTVDFGDNCRVNSVTVVDTENLSVNISVSLKALQGMEDITVETTGGNTIIKRDCFTIEP